MTSIGKDDAFASIIDIGRFAASCENEHFAEHVLKEALKHAEETIGPHSAAVVLILKALSDFYEEQGNVIATLQYVVRWRDILKRIARR